MDSASSWPGGFSTHPMTPFDAPFDGVQNEDWEDWLRWDPGAEPTSPEDGTMHSGSSKNDSPLQEPVFPVDAPFFGKLVASDIPPPPLVVGDDALDFRMPSFPDANETSMFGSSIEAPMDFDFNLNATLPPLQPQVSRIDTNFATWPLSADTPQHNLALSAVSAEHNPQLPSSGPQTATSPSIQFSPASSSHPRTSLASNSGSPPNPPPKKRGGRKRKAEVVEQSEQETKEEDGDSQDGDEPPVKKTSHNVIEKRYRNNLNDKIVELRNSVPSLRAMGRTNGGKNSEDLEGLTPAHKLNKATVMGKATEYIRHLEKRNKTMADEMTTLKSRLAAVEAAIGKPSDGPANLNNSPPSSAVRPRQASLQASPAHLNVPLEQTQYGQRTTPQQYMQQQSHPTYVRQPNAPVEAQNNGRHVNGRGGGVMNKVMMGAMAGFMVMEGFTEQSNDDSRQLFALPTAFFKRGVDFRSTSFSAALSRQAALPLLKTALILGVLLYLVFPLLRFSPRRKQKAWPTVRLPHAPSLASPVEVRRTAWLTAVQTVYVPKHFLLEVVAVTAKMFMLSLRRLIGSEAYNTITGTNKEEEAARVKAWDIAVDAQLAGGDAEVSYYRLLLTLMASGTLPDSPTRLMQKAVHFRVFFWDVANAGYGNMIGFKQLTERVGRIYWDSARKLQKELVHARAQGRPTEDDEMDLLPDHLARLVERECDEVLGDEMIQRAWNLAWNKPSAHGLADNSARDSVVEDHAIRSPLDAVAAWYANMLIDDTLIDTLGDHPSTWDAGYFISLAASIAPPATGTQARALAAKAVLCNLNRDANVVAALAALPAAPSGAGPTNFVSHAPAAPDVRLTLTLAKLVSLLASSAPPAARYRAEDTLAALRLAPADFTLLSAVAAYRLLKAAGADGLLLAPALYGLEDTAASLRVWIGTSAGRRAGLDQDRCGKVVDACLDVAKRVGGWDERDSGYNSAASSPVRASE